MFKERVVEVHHSIVVMVYGRTWRRKRHTFLKRRKDSFTETWHYFKRGDSGLWTIITKRAYEELLKPDNEYQKKLERNILKKLK